MSHDPCQVVFDALEREDCQPRGPVHKFTARCPSHNDRMPSLSVSEGVDRRAVLHCFAGCDTADVIRALGLSWGDLFPDGHRHAPRARQPRMVNEPLLVTVERVLGAAGIGYRNTASPDLIVADSCPACLKPDLWIHDDGKQLQASCWSSGCDSSAILAELTRKVTGGHRVAA